MFVDVLYGSHLPVLIKVIEISEGPVIEFGTGFFSTPYLHWACYLKKRPLLSYETSREFFLSYENFANDYHKIILIDSWESINLSGHYGVALVDHDPPERRREETKRLAQLADYIIVHDSQDDWHYNYSQVYPLFKYRKEFTLAHPHTMLLSNFKDLSKLTFEL